ncbi:hypothetical protein FB451DRAFT_1149473 [Mycena latifolia]|nr:hypothetical protein FB451DRAFT_1149473 [Mycena latifolia]
MSDEPAAKRKRTETDREPEPLVRSEIWMPYGDIILQAESTQFRVNRDILAHQSSVFKDMFSIPQPPNEPMVEGCPIVHVSDAAKDWQLLLEVLYDPFTLTNAQQPFPVLAAMLRLGRKYDFRKAKDDAVARIHSEFPADFKGWEQVGDEFTHIVTPRVGLLIELLNLAYECGICTSIPTLAMSCLNRYTLDTLFKGVQRDDGSYVAVASDANKLVLAVAHNRFLLFQRENMAWLDGDDVIPHESCESRVRCKEQKGVLLLNCIMTSEEDEDHKFAFTIDPWGVSSAELCDICEEGAKASYETSRQKCWDLLPSFFGLPDWKDLKDLD